MAAYRNLTMLANGHIIAPPAFVLGEVANSTLMLRRRGYRVGRPARLSVYIRLGPLGKLTGCVALLPGVPGGNKSGGT